jgi:hypothetical protein
LRTAAAPDVLCVPKSISQLISRRNRGAAEEICRNSGTSLDNIVRAHHFVGDLNVIYPALRVWHEKLAGAPIPFGAVRTPLPIPGCDIIMDMLAFQPDTSRGH